MSLAAWLTNSAGWTPHADAAAVLSGYATAIGAVIGAVSLLAILAQTLSNARIARETTAIDAHKEYIKLALEYPQLSSSEATLAHLRRKTFKGVLHQPATPSSEQALWFLSYVLFAMEQILGVTRRFRKQDQAWLATVQDQLAYHQPALNEVWPQWRRHYGRLMQRVVDEVLAAKIGPDGLLERTPDGRLVPAGGVKATARTRSG